MSNNTHQYHCEIWKDPDPTHFSWNNWQPRHIAWAITGVCVVASYILSVYLIFQHLRNYTKASQQRYIVRILLIVPIYSLDSWLSFRFYNIGVYFNVLRDCYEAFVLYTFFCLLLSYLGGDERAMDIMFDRNKRKLSPPLCCMTYNPRNRHILRKFKAGVLQYVIVRPITTCIALILQFFGVYCMGNINPRYGFLYLSIFNAISVTISMFSLVEFYLVLRVALKPYRPFSKFLVIKFIIFFSFWQGVIVALLVRINVIRETAYWTTENVAMGIENTLLCFEMLIAAILHMYAFSYKHYVVPADEGGKKTNVFRSLFDVIHLGDVVQDSIQSFSVVEVNEKTGILHSSRVMMHEPNNNTFPTSANPKFAQIDHDTFF